MKDYVFIILLLLEKGWLAPTIEFHIDIYTHSKNLCWMSIHLKCSYSLLVKSGKPPKCIRNLMLHALCTVIDGSELKLVVMKLNYNGRSRMKHAYIGQMPPWGCWTISDAIEPSMQFLHFLQHVTSSFTKICLTHDIPIGYNLYVT